MYRRLLILFLFLLAACGPVGGTDPYTIQGAAEGAIQATAQAKVDQDWNAQRTRQAAELYARQTQAALSARSTGQVQQAMSIQDAAYATALAMDLHGTAVSQEAIDAQYVVRMTEVSAQATQTYHAGEVKQRAINAFVILLWLAVAAMVIFITWMLLVAGNLGQDLARARAASADAAVRQSLVRVLGDGRIIDIVDRQLVIYTGTNVVDATPQKDQAISPTEFVARAAQAQNDNWDSNTIPRFDKMELSAGTWKRLTDILAQKGLVDKAHGTTTTTTDNRTLSDVWQMLRAEGL